jgi:hypothetical protein
VRIDHRNGTLHFGAQQLESDKVRNHLALLAKRLAKAASMMDPTPPAALEAKRRAAIDHARKHMETEHVRLVARKTVIEKRKEQQEQMQLEQVGRGRRLSCWHGAWLWQYSCGCDGTAHPSHEAPPHCAECVLPPLL